MENITAIAVGIYVVLFAFMVIYIITAIIFNIKAGIKYRQRLAKKLHQLRMSKMIRALGIDVEKYLHQERIHEIKQQMTRCAECQNTDKCDEDLASGIVTPNNISYCNNENELKNIASKQQD